VIGASRGRRRPGGVVRRGLVGVTAALLVAGVAPATAGAQSDPRVGLDAGYPVAEEAAWNVDRLANVPRAPGFDAAPNNFAFVNSDLALTGDSAVVGNYNGFQVYDISDPAEPRLRTAVVCPGGQGDVSVYGDLLFMSVEEGRARTDCTLNAASTPFMGVRVFDISDLASPVQVAAVQTCRGSHTHTLVTDPDDPANVYVYVSGTNSLARTNLAGCNNNPPTGENPSHWRIDVIRVPLAAPQNAAIVNQPRLFADPVTGRIDGLQNTPPTPTHPSGIGWSPQPVTDACHDITAMPEIGLAAGACEGNGILIDISDAANPKRIDAVADPNFAYWHSATFNNDGTKVVFTDEWGGGSGARCRITDRPEWGADAIFDIVDGKMQFASYFKMPAPQTAQENCVAHNGSLVPVPGRDIMVQAWYQGGTSVWDFTDSANPTEIAFFDRGPGGSGLWSTYWYNGNIFGTELSRGFDTFALLESEHMSANELAAASQIQLEQFNAQLQPKLTWAPSFAVAGSFYDQLVRAGGIDAGTAETIAGYLDRAERFSTGPQRRAAVAQLEEAAALLSDAPGQAELKAALLELAGSLRTT
jgi:hypothetical protein